MHESPRRNLELKAFDPDPARSLAVCRRLRALDEGVLRQRDTYFRARHGRLKLREQEPGGAELIQYQRADEPEERVSSYRIVPVNDGAALRAALGAALGVELTVSKRRHLFLWQGVRIHLDEVERLGSFVELEAVAAPGSDLRAEHDLVSQLRAHLQIVDQRLCASGYAQLLGARTEPD